jgi:hypothetical protein
VLDEEKRDYAGIAMETRTRAMSAQALPDYMKEVFKKDFGVTIQ